MKRVTLSVVVVLVVLSGIGLPTSATSQQAAPPAAAPATHAPVALSGAPLDIGTYKVASGELASDSPGDSGGSARLILDNTAFNGSTFLSGVGNVTLDWGTLSAHGSNRIHRVQIGYATQSLSTVDIVIRLHQNAHGYGVPGHLQAQYLLQSLPGSTDGQLQGYFVDVDLTGVEPLLADGPVGWSYEFLDNDSGPLLVGPPNAAGVVDALDDDDVAMGYGSTFNFGGSPFASTWLQLENLEGTQPDGFVDLGGALPGTLGPPLLAGSGTLLPGSPGSLVLSSARPNAPCALFIALAHQPVPFKGGTLQAFPIVELLNFTTGPSGSLPLSWPAWPSGLSGVTLYLQYAIKDPLAINGVSLSNAVAGIAQDGSVAALLTAFMGGEPDAADAAWAQLVERGVPAIPALLTAAAAPGTYAGGGWSDARSSIERMDSASLALMSLYAIDTVVEQSLDAHLAPILDDDNGGSESQAVLQAKSLYTSWWLLHQHDTLQQIQAAPRALEGSAFAFRGELAAPPAKALLDPEGKEKKDSSTPVKEKDGKAICEAQVDGPDAGNAPDPYAWKLTPGVAGGPTPYNCMAWAMNCQTDRWMQPSDAAGAHWMNVLTDYGYDPNTAVDCAAQCPANKGPKVKYVFHHPAAAADPTADKYWVHAMKQDENGNWTSKNGEGSVYTDIGDCQKFINKYYPPKAGMVATVKCFCK